MAGRGRRSDETHGHVVWPFSDPDYEDSGEGGLSVYAVWRRVSTEVCLPSVEGFLAGGVGLSEEESDLDIYLHPRGNDEPYEFSHPVRRTSSFLYMGSCGRSFVWAGEEWRGYFTPTRDELTTAGQELLSLLDEHVGSEADLVTFLDT